MWKKIRQKHLGVRALDAQLHSVGIKNWITIDAQPVNRTTVSNADAIITMVNLAQSTESITLMEKMTKNLRNSSREPNSNNALNANSGYKEVKDAVQCLADAVMNFVMIVGEVIVLTEHASTSINQCQWLEFLLWVGQFLVLLQGEKDDVFLKAFGRYFFNKKMYLINIKLFEVGKG